MNEDDPSEGGDGTHKRADAVATSAVRRVEDMVGDRFFLAPTAHQE
ncbi:MAG: hypothetical protein QME71_07135 [Dehalococcoidia bacterium]|nr:hypothetical protein [Dehalococcoidia bacterium]